jgi:hypothetical protein
LQYQPAVDKSAELQKNGVCARFRSTRIWPKFQKTGLFTYAVRKRMRSKKILRVNCARSHGTLSADQLDQTGLAMNESAGSIEILSSPSKRLRSDTDQPGSQVSSSPDDKTRSTLSNSKQVLQNASLYLTNCFDEVKLNVLDILLEFYHIFTLCLVLVDYYINMLQARHTEMIKLAVTERDKILAEIEECREKLKKESEVIKRENEAESKRIEEARYDLQRE